jgi:tetratricopeptide (TPR) repeat protein
MGLSQEWIMAINPIYERVYERITSHRYYLLSLICIFFLILIGYFIIWPVAAYDTDLWYHLSGGRYFWQNGSIPGDAYFSFITSPKSSYDYYWLFQGIVYKIFQWTGYQGLIIFRCFLFFLTALFICFFFVDSNVSRKRLLIGVSLFIAYPLALTLRELLIRPHLFSYLFIIVFLYILELKRDKIWLLPFLGILWCNIHGIEYPVMILILLAYLLEMYYQDLKKTIAYPGGNKKKKWFLILTMYTVFFTPHIVDLIKAPFNISYNNALYQQLYVAELIPIQISSILRFSVLPFSNLIGSFHNLLIIVPVIFFILCLWKRNLRISHIILFFASLVLLIKHSRFSYEFIILSIPLVRHGIGLLVEPSDNKERNFYRVMPIALIFVLVVLPFVTYGSHFKNRPEYPLTQIELPIGVTEFLNKLDVGGAILNEPNTGGYMQWALKKKYKIYMDMQLSVFNDRDFAYVNSALHDETTFRAFIRQYDPSFLSVSLDRPKFQDFIGKFNEYKPVFFDDTEVLYVNARHYRRIADTYELKQINVFEYKKINYEKQTKEQLSLILNEAMKIRHLYPGGGITNIIIANIMIVNKQYEEALIYADAVIHRYPNIAKGYAMKGDALRGLGRVEEAIASYQTAIDRGLKDDEGKVYWNLHTCYGHLKMYKKAYKAIAKFVNPFDPGANYRDIYALGISAAVAGERRDAINFLKIAQMKLPPDDIEYTKKINDNLKMLDPEDKKMYEQ